MKKRGRKPLPLGSKRDHRESIYLTGEESELLGKVAGHFKMDRNDLIRAAVFDRLYAAVERWGKDAAAKIVADRAHAKWMKECSDPEGAVQWALSDKP